MYKKLTTIFLFFLACNAVSGILALTKAKFYPVPVQQLVRDHFIILLCLILPLFFIGYTLFHLFKPAK